MKKTNKKGFTIVELVIVIAVVAILAAVLIPTFVNVVNKANVSNDTALVKNINTTLATEEVEDGKPATMYDALKMAENGGFDVSKLTPRSSGEIVWDEETNRFALIDGNKTVFAENGKTITESSKIWKFVSADNLSENTGYGSYITGAGEIETLTVSAGVDVGNNTVKTLNYENTGSGKTVTIRTNGGKLTVNGQSDTVNHYGAADYTDIKAVYTESYHEFGVSAYVRIEKGHFVAENTAKIINLNVAASNVTVKEESGAKVAVYSRAADNVTVTVNGKELTLDEAKRDENFENNAENNNVVADGGVAEIDGIKIKTLQAAINMAKSGDIVTLFADVKVVNMVSCDDKNLTIDFNGFTIENTIDIWENSNALIVVNGGSVTLKDSKNQNGGITAKKDDCYGINIKNGARVMIESGRYVGNISAVQVEAGSLVITGGKFDLYQIWPEDGKNGYQYEINCIDENYKDKKATVSIQGGVFVGFDPSMECETSDPKSYLADGHNVISKPHETISNINIYSVVKGN